MAAAEAATGSDFNNSNSMGTSTSAWYRSHPCALAYPATTGPANVTVDPEDTRLNLESGDATST